jgi:hypothetical protein
MLEAFQFKIPLFFPQLSLHLTGRILRQMNKKRAGFLIKQASEVVSENVDDQNEGCNELLQAVLTTLDSGAESTATTEEVQRWLRENIYHFLARVKSRQRSERPREYDVTDCFVMGMGPRLGLTQAEESRLLRDLAQEFTKWLNSCKDRTFVAGWGKIVGTESDSGTMRLEDFASGDSMRTRTAARYVPLQGTPSVPKATASESAK